ncbi:unnamed protein product [Blepharisma stoltei]|uniref:Uncharacterized protein n=1 Tax=Blepharisma stoltei TaxID=1481888 RepID=A0AAU9JK34_9CILI|nr:unnamed protein product [Blepharisma stoltei]
MEQLISLKAPENPLQQVSKIFTCSSTDYSSSASPSLPLSPIPMNFPTIMIKEPEYSFSYLSIDDTQFEALDSLEQKLNSLFDIVRKKEEKIYIRRNELIKRKNKIDKIREQLNSRMMKPKRDFTEEWNNVKTLENEIKSIELRIKNSLEKREIDAGNSMYKDAEIKEGLNEQISFLERKLKEKFCELENLKKLKKQKLVKKNEFLQKIELIRLERQDIKRRLGGISWSETAEDKNIELFMRIKKAEKNYRDEEMKKIELENELSTILEKWSLKFKEISNRKAKLRTYQNDIEAKLSIINYGNQQLKEQQKSNLERKASISDLKELIEIKIEAINQEEQNSQRNQSEIQEKIEILIQSCDNRKEPRSISKKSKTIAPSARSKIKMKK